jgi:hypothetical protein
MTVENKHRRCQPQKLEIDNHVLSTFGHDKEHVGISTLGRVARRSFRTKGYLVRGDRENAQKKVEIIV